MSNLKSYRTCFVPICKNTTKTTPDKMFLNVPQDDKLRNKWFQAVQRDNPKTNSNFFCCEDHFDLPNDMENYMQYRIMGRVSKVRTKQGCLPSKFLCQIDRWNTNQERPYMVKKRNQERPYIIKKRNKTIIEQCLNESTPSSQATTTPNAVHKQFIPEFDEDTSKADELKEEIERDDVKDMNQLEHEYETTSIQYVHKIKEEMTISEEEIEEEITIPEEEIKEEITIDEDDNFIPSMQSSVKTEEDPFKNEDQLSDVIGHDHTYEASIQTQPFHQTSVEDSSLNDKIFTNMAMELQLQKTLNDKKQKTIEELGQNVKKLNSQLINQNLLVEKLQPQIKMLTNMAMELRRQKTLNAKKQKTIEELRKNEKKLNSQLRKLNLQVEELQSIIKNVFGYDIDGLKTL